MALLEGQKKNHHFDRSALKQLLSLLYHRLIRIQRPGSLFARDDAILYEMSMETEAQKMPYF